MKILNYNEIILPAHLVPKSDGEAILMKLGTLSQDYKSATIHMADYVKFCFVGSDEVDFQEPTDNRLLAFGEYGSVNGMKLFYTKVPEEGFFRKDIDSCKIGGDHGLAWGLWQTHAPKKQVCSNRKNAIIIALNMMKQSFTSCKNVPLLDRMSIYTDGQCHTNWKRSRFKMNRAISYLSNHKLELENE